MLLISFREDPERVRRAVRDRGYTAPVLIDRDGAVTGEGYGVWGPPTAYLVDRRGRLVGRMVGSRDWGSPVVRALVLALLEADARP